VKELLEILGFILLILLVVSLIIIGVNTVYNTNYCNNLIELNPDRHFEWHFFGGCFLQTQDGIWVDVESIKFLDVSIDGVK